MARPLRQVTDDQPLAESHSDGEEPLSHLVVRTLATIEGVPIDALPPLNDAVDTDALSTLFDGDSTVERLTFSYQGYRVVVSGDERVAVYD